jgi:hypothetical protein
MFPEALSLKKMLSLPMPEPAPDSTPQWELKLLLMHRVVT